MTKLTNTTPNYLFDVDGTLVPVSGILDKAFFHWFSKWTETNTFYIVSCGTYDKLLMQVGKHILERAEAVFACAGNATYIQGKLVMHHEIAIPVEMLEYFDEAIAASNFEDKRYPHLDYRTGLVNFSICGRGTSSLQQEAYMKFDAVSKERELIADHINKTWPKFIAQIGGGIGIDITEKYRDKSQVADMVDCPLVFFADQINPMGNDFTLAKKLLLLGDNRVYNVKDWKETWESLKEENEGHTNVMTLWSLENGAEI